MGENGSDIFPLAFTPSLVWSQKRTAQCSCSRGFVPLIQIIYAGICLFKSFGISPPVEVRCAYIVWADLVFKPRPSQTVKAQKHLQKTFRIQRCIPGIEKSTDNNCISPSVEGRCTAQETSKHHLIWSKAADRKMSPKENRESSVTTRT